MSNMTPELVANEISKDALLQLQKSGYNSNEFYIEFHPVCSSFILRKKSNKAYQIYFYSPTVH